MIIKIMTPDKTVYTEVDTVEFFRGGEGVKPPPPVWKPYVDEVEGELLKGVYMLSQSTFRPVGSKWEARGDLPTIAQEWADDDG